MKLVALAGRAGSGKDTVADMIDGQLERRFNHDYTLILEKFAAPIKAAIEAMFGIDLENMSRAEKEAPLAPFTKSPRQLMQTLGTEWGRDLVDADLWVKLLAGRLAEITIEDKDWIVITDCRFPNEFKWVQDVGGEVWWVERDGLMSVTAHSSEESIRAEHCHRVVKNLGNLDDLFDNVGDAVDAYVAYRTRACA